MKKYKLTTFVLCLAVTFLLAPVVCHGFNLNFNLNFPNLDFPTIGPLDLPSLPDYYAIKGTWPGIPATVSYIFDKAITEKQIYDAAMEVLHKYKWKGVVGNGKNLIATDWKMKRDLFRNNGGPWLFLCRYDISVKADTITVKCEIEDRGQNWEKRKEIIETWNPEDREKNSWRPVTRTIVRDLWMWRYHNQAKKRVRWLLKKIIKKLDGGKK